ncbi:hypothetical protein HAX54_049118, partial [Datura stramonium]|nr:hypothetical protein [Datura stramonium]
ANAHDEMLSGLKVMDLGVFEAFETNNDAQALQRNKGREAQALLRDAWSDATLMLHNDKHGALALSSYQE